MAKILMIAGAIIFLTGSLLWKAPWLFHWFGKLPGDINYDSGNIKVFAPLASTLLLSALVSLLISFFRR